MSSPQIRLASWLGVFRRLSTLSAARGSCCSPPFFTAVLIMLFDWPRKGARVCKRP